METPNFYAIIPADIRYSKELSMFQKLLYAEITALTQKDWFCWASNKYFAELYEMWATWISKQISDLAKKWFIQVFIDKEKWNQRKIFIWETKKVSWKTSIAQKNNTIAEKDNTSCIKVQDPYCTKVQENNININNINNNKKNKNNKLFLLKKREWLKKYWEYKNVKLTEEEIERLKKDFSEIIFEKYLKILDEWIELKWYKYKNHNLAMRKWMEKDWVRKTWQPKNVNLRDII